MGIVQILPDLAGSSLSVNDKGHRTIVVSWLFEFSDKANEGAYNALALVPQLRTIHPIDTQARCIGRTVSFANYSGQNGIVYRGSATYSSEAEESQNPIDWRPKLRRIGVKATKIVEEDKNAVAILNKAGDKYESPVEVPSTIRGFIYTRNLPYNPRTLADQLEDTINNAAWLGYPARTVFCVRMDISDRQTAIVNDVEIPYWTAEAEFSINLDEWKVRLLEQGYREKVAGELKDIMVKNEDDEEERAAFPILLNNLGRAQLEDPKVPLFTDWYVYKEENFDLFDIPTLEGL